MRGVLLMNSEKMNSTQLQCTLDLPRSTWWQRGMGEEEWYEAKQKKPAATTISISPQTTNSSWDTKHPVLLEGTYTKEWLIVIKIPDWNCCSCVMLKLDLVSWPGPFFSLLGLDTKMSCAWHSELRSIRSRGMKQMLKKPWKNCAWAETAVCVCVKFRTALLFQQD